MSDITSAATVPVVSTEPDGPTTTLGSSTTTVQLPPAAPVPSSSASLLSTLPSSRTSSTASLLSTLQSSRTTSQPTNTSAAKPSSTTAKAGSTDVAAIAAGVTVSIVVLSLLVIGFLLFRRNKKRRHDEEYKKQLQNHLGEAQLNHEKPELQGGPHDASIAGPVKPKSELHSTSAQMRSEAVGSDLLTATQSSMSELSGEPSAYELGLGSLRDREKKALQRRGESIGTESQPSNTIVASSSQRSKTAATATNEAERYDADLIAEADDLVQELGLITSRKRRLEKSAATLNMKPEDVEGSKGEDYRELLRRQERLRKRMEEIAEERSGTG